MKKSEKAGLICLVMGLLLMTIGFAIADFKLENLNTAEKKEYVTKEYISDINKVSEIEIDTEDCEVQVEPVDGNELRITYQETKDEIYTIEDHENVVLKKKATTMFSNIQVFNWMTFDTTDKEIMHVYLPKSYTGNINITSSYAPIVVKDFEQLGDIFIENDQEDIQLSNIKANTVTLESSYGKLHGSNLVIKEMAMINIEQGELSLEHIEAEDMTIDGCYSPVLVNDLKIQKTWTSTMDQGSLTANKVSAQDIELFHTYGNIMLDDIKANHDIQFYGEQGDININGIVAKKLKGEGSYADLTCEKVDVNSFDLTMDQGDTNGSFVGKMDDYYIKTDIEHGRKNLPDYSSKEHPKKLFVNSSYGDVHITFEK